MIKKIEGLEEALERESKALRASELDYDDIEIFITAARAYAKIQSGECVVVPREPTEKMIDLGFRNFQRFAKPHNAMCNAYRAMIQAGEVKE